MPRRLRLHVSGGFYHATLRGNHKQPVFHAPADRMLLNAIVGRSLARHPARIHAYCWMTNHLHFFVQVADEPLGSLMRDIASNYARAFQRKLETTGHLFERRYHAKLVDTEAYLFEVLRYIHLNPVTARLVGSAAQYPWSSHRAYAGLAAPEQWLTVEFALAAFARDRREAHLAYSRFVGQEPAKEFATIIEGDAEAIGDDGFLARLRSSKPAQDRPETLADLLAEACQRFHTCEQEIRSPSREARLVRIRAWVAHQAAKRRIASLSAVARALGRDRATLRYALRVHAATIE